MNQIIKTQDKIIKKFLIVFVLLILIMVGGVMNTVAKDNNSGQMPVLSTFTYSTDTHFTFQEKDEVNKYFLTDRFKIGKIIYSIGDFIVYTSYFFLLVVITFLIVHILQLNKLKKQWGFE